MRNMRRAGQAIKAVDTAQNVATWLTATEEEIPGMIAFAAAMRLGTKTTGELARWYRGAPTAPLGQRLAVGLQAEWEMGFRQSGQELPETIMVKHPETGVIHDVRPAQIFHDAGYKLAEMVDSGKLPKPGTAAARVWELELQRAGNTPQARAQKAAQAVGDLVKRRPNRVPVEQYTPRQRGPNPADMMAETRSQRRGGRGATGPVSGAGRRIERSAEAAGAGEIAGPRRWPASDGRTRTLRVCRPGGIKRRPGRAGS